jgi:hypothetical protein
LVRRARTPTELGARGREEADVEEEDPCSVAERIRVADEPPAHDDAGRRDHRRGDHVHPADPPVRPSPFLGDEREPEDQERHHSRDDVDDQRDVVDECHGPIMGKEERWRMSR